MLSQKANAATAVNSNSVLTDAPVVTGGLLEVNNSTLAPLVHISAAFCFASGQDDALDRMECALWKIKNSI